MDYSFYTIFPNGLKLFIYKKKNNESIYISAKWVKSIKKIFYHFKGDIRIVNSIGYILKTEEIFFNLKNKKIYNEKYTIISTTNGMVFRAKNGIESSDNLSNIKLKNISGTISIR
ncbi:hypothetical protein [Blattabacterium cuenoti]|uniref:hypothetical protein n=1 Tax=Blattabacterium cuenoti TaxID=1653831 RepID=UPI001EEC6B76|nr:hypothetical protein [Blattabacterium cuenoti]